MMKLLMSLLSLLLLFGCAQKDPSPKPPAEKVALAEAVNSNNDSTLALKDKAKFENIQFQMSEAILLGSSNNIAIPVLLEERYVGKGFPDHSYVNIAVILDQQPQAKLLFHETMIIRRIQVYEPKVDRVLTQDQFYQEDESDSIYKHIWARQFEGLLFFEACRFQNKKCDYQRLYCYDLKNDHMRQLSPENVSVVEYRFFKGTSRVIITCSMDSNQDGIFEENEDQNMSIVDFRSESSQATLLLPLDSLKQFKREYSIAN